MAQINHNISTPNDGLGDALRQAFENQNQMNTELYTDKVDKILGKDLSENDFTDALKFKLENLEDAPAQIQSDYAQTDDTAPDFIKNKPAAVDVDLGYNQSPTQGTVTNSFGDDAIIPLADETNAGLMSPGDFTRLVTLGIEVKTASFTAEKFKRYIIDGTVTITQPDIAGAVSGDWFSFFVRSSNSTTYNSVLYARGQEVTARFNSSLGIWEPFLTKDKKIDGGSAGQNPETTTGKNLILLRGDTAANWTSANPILSKNELCLEEDTNKIKRGNGVDTWTALPYIGSGGAVDLQAVLDAGGSAVFTNGNIDLANQYYNFLTSDLSGNFTNFYMMPDTLEILSGDATHDLSLGMFGGFFSLQKRRLSDSGRTRLKFEDPNFPGANDVFIPSESGTQYLATRNWILNRLGLESLNEGNGIGFRLVGKDPANYGNIGLGAVDLSHSDVPGATRGATGAYSNAEGRLTTASNTAAHAEGNNTIASGYAAHAEGNNNFARAGGEHSGGEFGTDYTPTVGPTDRLVNYGNGPDDLNRRDAWTLYKNGAVRFFRATLASITNAAAGFFIFDSSNSNRPNIHNGTAWKGLQYVDEIKTSNFTAELDLGFKTNGTITVTDPTPVANKGYIVFVVSGTTTIDGVGYTANKLVYRFYNGTSWTSTVINGGGDSRIKVLYQNSLGDIASHTGDTAETVLLSLDIPANTFKSGDTMGFIIRLIKDTTLGSNTLRTRIGPTGTTADGTLSTTTVAAGGNSPMILAERNRIEFRSGNIVRVSSSLQSMNTDLTNGAYGSYSSILVDTTILNKLTITVQLGDASATSILDAYQITQIIG